MDQSLRYEKDRDEPQIETLMDFSDSMGILRAAEKCNGSGDCRKPEFAGGTMCPSYRATKDEKDSTRARANALREFLTRSDQSNPFDREELKRAFDLCLSCKACASECPSNVDVAAFKAEFLYQYQKENGVSFRTKMFAENAKWNQLGSLFPWLTNTLMNTRLSKQIMGIAPERKIPALSGIPLNRWIKKQPSSKKARNKQTGQVYLFVDEFSNFYETEIGKDCIRLFSKLGYEVLTVDHVESGRSYISKGLLDQAKKMADKNVSIFKDLLSEDTPMIGIEPSAILTFRDEYLRLADDREAALEIAKHVYTAEEFVNLEVKKGKISSKQFNDKRKQIKIHGHCQQKSLSNIESTFKMLNLPVNYEVSIMNTGCCGMAGSFGYEKEHYEISMKVGEASLFPKIRKAGTHVEISAAGTSCRHQILDGTRRKSKHPISLLAEALK
jgi:Fe-S oxidoreductase